MDNTEPANEPAYALVELMGHRQVAGQVREVDRYGTRMLRIDTPAIDGQPATTHYYAGGAIYGEHPCDQATAERLAAQLYQPPAHQLALGTSPAATATSPWDTSPADDDPDPDPDNDDPY